MPTSIKEIDIEQYDRMDAEELLAALYREFGNRVALGTSLQKTGVVMIDMLHRMQIPMRIFFIDTLVNPPETIELLHEVEQKYNLKLEIFKPSDEDIESLNKSVGQWAHYMAREMCCSVRKRLPLQRALDTLDVWITGQRLDQSDHRNREAKRVSVVTSDSGNTILKANPLLTWSSQEVEEYTQSNKLPYNKLYDYVSRYGEKYNVLGCAPCHIPVNENHDTRAGKFPWEQGKKECGLHDHGSGI